MYININYPNIKEKDVDTLGKRIKYLKEKKVLSEPLKMNNLKVSRNKFAHEVGEYSTWDEVKNALKDIDNELRHLKIIS